MYFACISLSLWLTLPFPPSRQVMGIWSVLTSAIILGVVFFVCLKSGGRRTWTCAAAWAALSVAYFVLGVIQTGFPRWTDTAMGVTIVLVCTWGFAQVLVLLCFVSWWFRKRGTTPAPDERSKLPAHVD